jgi:hypothetical protein
MGTPEATVREFVAFYDKHSGGKILIASDVAKSEGCGHTPGGCCSKSLDLADLLDLLRELAK